MKNRASCKEEQMGKEIDALKAQLSSQDGRIQSLIEGLKSDILTETQNHFNGFTRHLEQAFIKEQAANRRQHLVFTGVPEAG